MQIRFRQSPRSRHLRLLLRQSPPFLLSLWIRITDAFPVASEKTPHNLPFCCGVFFVFRQNFPVPPIETLSWSFCRRSLPLSQIIALQKLRIANLTLPLLPVRFAPTRLFAEQIPPLHCDPLRKPSVRQDNVPQMLIRGLHPQGCVHICMETISQVARSIHRPQKQLCVVKLKERSGIFFKSGLTK